MATARVTIWGAARSTAGSRHLVELAGRTVLLDCGAGAPFPFAADHLDAVVVSHAHADHIGGLPDLVAAGYRGRVYASRATVDLLSVIVGARVKARREKDRISRLVRGQPIDAGPADAAASRLLSLCHPLDYGEPARIARGVELTLTRSGHVLGSAVVHLRTTGRVRRTVTFTGDVGRFGVPLLRPPEPLPPADVVLCESTYGGRDHEPFAATAERLAELAGEAIGEGGQLLIPAFSLGRTQLVLHTLAKLRRAGRIPDAPVWLDNPSAGVMNAIHDCYPDELTADEPGLGVAEAIPDEFDRPAIILASGGMCDGGRITRHLRARLDDPRCRLALVSYQAPGTLGRRLTEKSPTVWMQGRRWNKWIGVAELSGFSGHAGRSDLRRLLEPIARPESRLLLVHGEAGQAAALAGAAREWGFGAVRVPELGEACGWGP